MQNDVYPDAFRSGTPGSAERPAAAGGSMMFIRMHSGAARLAVQNALPPQAAE